MRSNLPVTQREYVLKDDETIVSKTDLKGKITYVNQDFVRISGFAEEELLGAPHNIVRHPDMPEEAFEDMWRTLKSGKAWTGLVKNRCKNGDHYWVEANAAPLIENHQVTGYTSIRGKPSRQQVHEAEAAYRLIKSGQSRLRIHEGHAIARSAFSWHGQLEELTLSAKMLMVFGVLLLLSCANALLAYLMQGNGSNTLGTSAIAVAGVGVLATILSGMLLYKAIVGPLRYALDEIETMSSGDLTSKIQASGSDEVAKLLQALRVLQINTKFLVGQIRQSTDIVNDEASEIADGVMDLSHRTESQANSLEQTASSMTQFTTIVKRNAGQALEASNLIRSTAEIASKGGDAVNHVVDTMSSIKASSSKMADIISVIDGIAFQTNILALNAAVEAARAGEQGRGFAVVASEVRNLAQRSAGAAKEIKVLIHNSIETVEEGSHLVDIAGHTMSDIVEAVQHASEIMMAISASGQEQTEGIDQVNRAMRHMDEITQQNAALGEQAAAASSTMKEQAHHLSELVGAFRLMSGNARSAALPEIRRAAVASPSRQVAPQNRMLK